MSLINATNDILRIMSDLVTFTQEDIQQATGLSTQGANARLLKMSERGLIERVRVGHYWLYALSRRGQVRVSALPALDPEEMCLPLTFEGVTPCDCRGVKPDFTTKRILSHTGGVMEIAHDKRCGACGASWETSIITHTDIAPRRDEHGR